MPCYSTIQLVFIDVDAMKEVAKALGITVEMNNQNRFTLKKGNEYVTIERMRPGEKFTTERLSGSDEYFETILQPMMQPYAKTMLKKFAAKRGYNVSAGDKPNQYVMTKF